MPNNFFNNILMATSTSKLLCLPRKRFPLVAQYLILGSCIFFIISIHPKRYQILFQEHVTKAFSWKTYNYNAKKSCLWKAQTYDIKSLFMEGNITYILLKTKRASSWEISFKYMIMETNLTNLCTRLDIFSVPSILSIFPLQS